MADRALHLRRRRVALPDQPRGGVTLPPPRPRRPPDRGDRRLRPTSRDREYALRPCCLRTDVASIPSCRALTSLPRASQFPIPSSQFPVSVIDPDRFRSVLGRFASSVTVLTTRDES